MDITLLFSAAILLIIVVINAGGVLDEVRGSEVPKRPRWWPFGAAGWSAWRRTNVAWFVGVAAGILPFGVVEVFFGNQHTDVSLAVALLFGGIGLAFGCLGITAALFAWPRIVLPADLRDSRGLLHDLSGRGRDRQGDP